MFITAKTLAIAPSSVNSCNPDYQTRPARPGPGFLHHILCFFLLSLAVTCITVSAAPVLVIDQTTDKFSLTRHADIIDDPDANSGIDAILLPDRLNQFAPVDLSSRSAIQDYSNHFWLRFSVHNPSDQTVTLWLTANHNTIAAFNLYRLGKEKRYTPTPDALFQDPELAPILKSLEIPARSTVTYLAQIHTQGQQALNINLARPATFLPEQINRAILFSLALGILGLTAFINLLLALYRKSPLFLFNSCYILANTGIQAAGLGLPRSWLHNFGELQHTITATLFYISTAAALMCAQEYIRSSHNFNHFYLWLKKASYFNLFFGLLVIFLSDTWGVMVLLPFSLALPVILASFFDAYRRHNDRIALALGIVIAVSASVFVLLVLFRTTSFSLDALIDPRVLYLFVVHALVISTLFIIREYSSLHNELEQKLVMQIHEARNRAQNDLLQEMSGDMQTPLSGILGMADLLRSSSLTAEQHAKVDAIKNSGQALLNKIADIHYRVQLEHSSEHVRKSPFELPLLLDNCINSFRLSAETRNIELILQIQPDISPIVRGDEYRLRQIIIQLLQTAIQSTEQGQVLLKVSRNATDHDIIYFSIADTGKGIPQDRIMHLSRTQKSSNPLKNTGLDTASQLLGQLKSELMIDSIEGEGTTYSFLLRMPAVEQNPRKYHEPEDILHYKRVMIVDDNHTTCKVLKQLASSWGMQVAEVHSAAEALAMYRAKHNIGETFDAIIVDYDMPQVSGMEVAEKITLEAREKQPVIIMLAGISQSPAEHHAKQKGVDIVLNKPVSQKLLKLTLYNLFQMRLKTVSPVSTQKKLHILVADDNDVIRSVISRMMETLNIEHRMVSDGKMAVEAAKKETFDIILMDCEMPFMSGFEATEKIHDWQREKHQELTPVIALTAYTLGEHRQRSIAAGMVDFLEKPINMTELEAVLQRYRKNP